MADTNLTTTTTRQLSISIPSVDAGLLEQASRLLTDGRGPDGRRVLVAAPSTELRARLAQRLALVNHDLAPAKRTEIASAVKELFVGFPSMRGTGEDAKVIVAKYVKDIEDLPLWAIQGACMRLNRGSVEGASLDFAPSSARVRAVAIEIALPMRAERVKISDVLQGTAIAKPTSDAERDYVRRGFEQLQAELRGKAERAQGEDRATFRKASDALAEKREAVLAHPVTPRDEAAA